MLGRAMRRPNERTDPVNVSAEEELVEQAVVVIIFHLEMLLHYFPLFPLHLLWCCPFLMMMMNGDSVLRGFFLVRETSIERRRTAARQPRNGMKIGKNLPLYRIAALTRKSPKFWFSISCPCTTAAPLAVQSGPG